ncbi:MAG: heparinase II/III-family protein [Oscillospiraceae bacterium]|nr:heparinase II/III-family protein [Oscillospiraceae bacterium]
MLSKVKKLIGYKEILISTEPTYWIHYVRHSYFPKKNRINEYQTTPDNLRLCFLDVSRNEFNEVFYNSRLSANIIERANRICDGYAVVFDVETSEIKGKWSEDPKTGYNWLSIYYKDVRGLCPQGTVENHNDIKYAWELGCLHFLVTLAQAYAITNESKYKENFFELLDDWVEQNPVGYGVNWCCTIDVALRAINIIVAASIFAAFCGDFEEEFQPYSKLLYTHMLFIYDNLEYGFVRENHFVADIVGLKVLSQIFPQDSVARKMYNFSKKQFQKEVLFQVLPDGVEHEASTAYHGLVLELFVIGLATDGNLMQTIKPQCIARLNQMVSFSEKLLSFHHFPIIGDNDSERVLDLNGTGTFRKEVVDFANYVLGNSADSINEYSFLCAGTIGKEKEVGQTRRKPITLTDYAEGGYVYCKNDNFRLLIHAGSIGRRGRGGHGHNDQTSFVLDIGVDSFIIDPGSCVYERDLEKRHKYRSTKMHNCVALGDIEQNKIKIETPFKMDNDTKCQHTSRVFESQVEVECVHFGYAKSAGCNITRKFIVSDNLSVRDSIEGSYRGDFSVNYVFADTVELRQICSNAIEAHTGNQTVEIIFEGIDGLEIYRGTFSESYGKEQPTCCLLLKGHKDSEHAEVITNIKIVTGEIR